MKYCVVKNVRKEDLKRYSYSDEEFRQLLSSPYLVSNYNRIWYDNNIYYEISLNDFFKYILHGEEDD